MHIASADGNFTDIIRTCEDELEIDMYTVPGSCLYERGSGFGQLCLCRNMRVGESKPCNVASSTVPSARFCTLLAVILLYISQHRH